MKLKKFKDSVSASEFDKLIKNKRFDNLFKLINSLSKDELFPQTWLISSIDNLPSGEARYPKEKGNHYASQAVDLVPLSKDDVIRLPIPLNRNLLLMRLFKTAANDAHNKGFDLPIIVFEADHIHCDVNHDFKVIYINQTRSYLDKFIHSKSISGLLHDAINDNKLIEI